MSPCIWARRLLPRNYTSLAQQRGPTFAAAADMRLGVSLARGDADGMRMGQASGHSQWERGRRLATFRVSGLCKSAGKVCDRDSKCCKFRKVRAASGEHERREKESSSKQAMARSTCKTMRLRPPRNSELRRTIQVIRGPNNRTTPKCATDRLRAASLRDSRGVLCSGYRVHAAN